MLTDIISNETHLTVLLNRYGSKSCPMLCVHCAKLCREAQQRASECLCTSLGQYLLRVAEAFYRRDGERISHFYSTLESAADAAGSIPEPALPLDAHGGRHIHLELQATCCWVPFVGRTAEAARVAAAKEASKCKDDSVRVCGPAAMSWYSYKSTSAKGWWNPAVSTDGADLHRELTNCSPSSNSAFFSPFLDIFLLAFRHSEEVHMACRSHLERHWNTYYGVSRVVTALLGVPLPTKPLNKTAGHLFGFWCSFLFFSPFGVAVDALGAAEAPPQLQSVVVRMQLFFYKICEVRKGACLWRRFWRDSYKDFGMRTEYVQRALETHRIVWPFWRHNVDPSEACEDELCASNDAWSAFAEDLISRVGVASHAGQAVVQVTGASALKRPAGVVVKRRGMSAVAKRRSQTAAARETRHESIDRFSYPM